MRSVLRDAWNFRFLNFRLETTSRSTVPVKIQYVQIPVIVDDFELSICGRVTISESSR